METLLTFCGMWRGPGMVCCGMVGPLGTEHLLVSAATRYIARLSVMLGQQRQ
jgi:hypothetical protein